VLEDDLAGEDVGHDRRTLGRDPEPHRAVLLVGRAALHELGGDLAVPVEPVGLAVQLVPIQPQPVQ